MTRFAVWAPRHRQVGLLLGAAAHAGGGADRGGPDLGAPVAMERLADGWWVRDEPAAGPGTDYAFVLDDDPTPRPDPRTRWQPYGVHGPSRVYDHGDYAWQDGRWTGRILPGAVIYELHVGTFTPGGTFDSAIDRLDHLVGLGVTLVELMPINATNGQRTWGYDGVCWFAPHEPYGGPDGLKRLVDACHQRGLGVLVDVVYNHFGPSGAYAPLFGPYLASAANPWGAGINLDGPDSPEVRRYIVDSAVAWLRDYHVDGLRLDAVHALVDRSDPHLLEQLATAVDGLATELNRPLTLVAESDLNDVRLVGPREAGGYGLTAQWNDDAHHALHAVLTGERQGYYADFGALSALATVWQSAFLHAGTFSTFRGRVHGQPVDRARVSGHRFVSFLQNHDQIGNRAAGDRLAATLPVGLLKVGAVLLFTGPFTPMLFMGEEWGADTPWQYFTSHPEPELGAAVAAGRRAEFATHGWAAVEVPDPQDPATFRRSILDWSQVHQDGHAELLALHRELIRLRRTVADLSDPRLDQVEVTHGVDHLIIRRGRHLVVANLGSAELDLDLPQHGATWQVLLATEAAGATVGPGARLRLHPRAAAILA